MTEYWETIVNDISYDSFRVRIKFLDGSSQITVLEFHKGSLCGFIPDGTRIGWPPGEYQLKEEKKKYLVYEQIS